MEDGDTNAVGESEADEGGTERFRALFENTTDAIAEVRLEDDEFVVLDVNPAFEEVFGYEASDIVGEDIDEFVLPDGEDDAMRSIGGPMKRHEQVAREVRRQTTDGLKDFHARTVPLEVGGGWTQGFVIYTDISERKAKQRRLERFAGVLGHDLRNPLQVARGHINAVHDDPDLADSSLPVALTALENMSEIIDGLLTLTRAEDPTVDPVPVDLGPVAEQAWTLLDVAEPKLVVEADGLLVVADEQVLRQLLVNLFRNAVDHAGPAVTVRVGPLDDGFFVADDGPGIPEAHRDRVFEEGYTTSDEGLGLGLRIVKQFVDAHGWTISITDSRHGGARFEITDVDVPDSMTSPSP